MEVKTIVFPFKGTTALIRTENMSDKSGESKYIKSSKCRCKYFSDDEHFKNGVGYNILEEIVETSVEGRGRRT